MKNKYNKSSVRASQFAFVLALTLLAVTSYSQNTYTFGSTGAVQTLTLTGGDYKFECWGADGGLGNINSGSVPNSQIAGGAGGYSSGTITIATSTVLYIEVGGRGADGFLNPTAPGGYNGGGNGSTNSTHRGGGGGGATHIAISPGLLNTLSGNQSNVLIVAGGGGGGGNQSIGGAGGGLIGIQPPNSTQFSGRTAGAGGTQTAPGACYTGGSGAGFGKGGTSTQNLTGGGGGGWYGGCTGENSTGGGGGSSYTGGVSSGVTYTIGDPNYVANPDVTGNGFVKITELCSISLSVTGLGSNGQLCQGGSIVISTDAISNYTWTDGSFGPVFVATPATSTVYGLTAMSPANCMTSAQVSITVNPLPAVNVTTSAQAICFGESVVLSADGADTYSWSTNATAPTITLTPNQTATYSVTGTNTLTECEFTDMVTVNVLKPTVAIIGNSVICKGNTTTLTAFGDGATFYSWSTGSPGQSIIESPATHSIYAVTANVTTLNVTCSALSNFTVLVNPLPKIVANPDRFAVCLGETAEFSATGGVNYSWKWQTETSNAPTFIVGAEQLGSISVNVTGTDANGCSNTVATSAMVYACTGIHETLAASEIISVYPNPSQGNISLTVNSAYGGGQLELHMLNETGQLVRKIILNEENEYKTSVSELSTGLYFLTGNDGSRRISGKITVIK